MLGIKRTKSVKTLGLSIRMIEAIPRYRGLQGSIVTVLIRRPYIPGTFDRVLRTVADTPDLDLDGVTGGVQQFKTRHSKKAKRRSAELMSNIDHRQYTYGSLESCRH